MKTWRGRRKTASPSQVIKPSGLNEARQRRAADYFPPRLPIQLNHCRSRFPLLLPAFLDKKKSTMSHIGISAELFLLEDEDVGSAVEFKKRNL